MKTGFRRAFWFLLVMFACGFGALLCSARGRYIARAYLLPGDGTSLRGYPTLSPPDHYTGTWTHYAYTGRVLAVEHYLGGHADGRQVYLDDQGQPYCIHYIKEGFYDHSDLDAPVPLTIHLPRCYPRAWYGPFPES
jgi:hypothetical protein